MSSRIIKELAEPADMTGARRLAVASFVFLFYELACIRWSSAFVLYLSYYSNIVLLACFLGMGLGLLSAGRRRDLIGWFPLSLLLLLSLTFFFQVEVRMEQEGVIYFTSSRAPFQLPAEVAVGCVFLLVAFQSMLLTQEIGRLFATMKPLRAYAINVGASIAGVLGFAICSWFSLPASSWFLVLGACLLSLMPSGRTRLNNALLLAGCVLLVFYADLTARWSPYYRLSHELVDERHPEYGYIISVNGIWHQVMQPMQFRVPFYHAPYQALGDRSRYRRVLVIGAGSGNDVATALHYGAEHVDAVEIDPGILRLGRELHPDHPYDDPRVSVSVTDAREFLRRTGKPYDLIIFGLPDSLTLASSVANLRLESYLFTVESFEAVRSHLAPDGLVVLYNYYRKPWLVDKLAGMLAEVFPGVPRIFLWERTGYVATILAGPGASRLSDISQPEVPMVIPAPPPARDDWPFLYLRDRSLAPIYIRFIAFVLITSFACVWLAAPRGTLSSLDAPLFFMGAAFMLLEASAVVRLSLLFGSTWRVNAAVFTGVLAMIFTAVFLRDRLGIGRSRLWFAALGAALLLAAVLPIESFSTLPAGGWIAALIVMAPVMIANLIFADLFAASARPHIGLASNVLGAVVGGLAEYMSMLTGYRMLFVAIAAFYALALIGSLHARATGVGRG